MLALFYAVLVGYLLAIFTWPRVRDAAHGVVDKVKAKL